MLTARGFPPRIQAREIHHVEGRDRASFTRGVFELILVWNRLVAEPGFLAVQRVIACLTERPRESGVDHFVKV